MDEALPESRKRPRPVLSCVDCRRKKLKCDRLLPCRQCKKAGRSVGCTYSSRQESLAPAQLSDKSELIPENKTRVKARIQSPTEPHEWGSQSDVPRMKLGVIEDLQHRVDKIERLLSNESRLSTLAHGQPCQADRLPPSYLGTLSIKGSRTRYHGQNHIATLLNQVSSLIVRSPTIATWTCIADSHSLQRQKYSSKRILPIQVWQR